MEEQKIELKIINLSLIHIYILIHLICVKDIRIKKSNYLSKVPTLIKQIFPPKAMWMLQLFWNQHSHLHIEKAVSYTHLDVYKRQGRPGAARAVRQI